MDSELQAIASNGERCDRERHRFRIGVDDRHTTEFDAGAADFLTALEKALIVHATTGRAGSSGAFLQVHTAAGWRNVQNRQTGAVLMVTPEIAGQRATVGTLFAWGCDAVQMARDLATVTRALAEDAAGPG